MKYRRQLLALFGLFALSMAHAHEVRPAYLQLDEHLEGVFNVLWKQPVLGERRLPLEPRLPPECRASKDTLTEHLDGALIQRWQVHCRLRSGEIRIDGLSRTLTDVMVKIHYLGGDEVTGLLRSDVPMLDLEDTSPAALEYLVLGIEHLLFGIDHVLFVIGLVLFIRGFWPLLKAVTAFTLAHSITLGLSVLQLVYLPQKPVEVIIALSIVFLARELCLPPERRSRLASARPWIMAFGFGLLHGFGFAGALQDIGLPQDDLALALFTFNVGIELGQLLIIGGILLLGGILRDWFAKDLFRLQRPTAIVVGSLAAYWTLGRLILI